MLKNMYKKKISVTYSIKIDMITNQTKRGFYNGKRTDKQKNEKKKGKTLKEKRAAKKEKK